MLQLLRVLLEQGVIECDAMNQQWLWHDDRWKQLAAFSRNDRLDVVELVSQQLQRLPGPCIQLLKTAACLGAEVEYDILVTILASSSSECNHHRPNEEVQEMLRLAVAQGLMIEQLPHRPGRHAFCHDRIQQAAYSLIPMDQKATAHVAIGRALLHSLSLEEQTEHIFVLVNQLLFGVELLVHEDDKVGLAKLCIIAGQKASRSSDFDTAKAYYQCGISLLPQRNWRDEYHLSLELFNCRAEAELGAADFEAGDFTVEEILANCRTFHDKIPAYHAKIFSLGNRTRFEEAINLGLKVLDTLGLKCPPKPSLVRHLIPQLIKVKRKLHSVSDDDLLNLPMMDIYDSKNCAALSIIALLMMYTFCSNPDLFAYLSLRGLRLSLKHGLRDVSCFTIICYGIILCALDQHEEGYRYAQLSLKLSERFASSKTHILPRLHLAGYGVIIPWKEPVRSTLVPLKNAATMALDSGDIECAMFVSHALNTNMFVAGLKLSLYDKGITDCMTFMTDSGPWLALTQLDRHLVNSLTGKCKRPVAIKLETNFGNAEEFQLYHASAELIKLQLAYHLGNMDIALKAAKDSRTTDDSAKTSIYYLLQYLYDGLTTLEAARHAKWQLWRHVWRVHRIIAILERYAKVCPDNLLHKVFLLRGELAALKGHLRTAMDWYWKAMEHAKTQGIMQLHGLAHERAATALRRLGTDQKDLELATKLMNGAIDIYQDWGATALVAHLKTKL